jgi:putative DNA methylase
MNTEHFIQSLYVEDIVSKLSQEETGKRQYYRPAYSLHKWWARRPGALFRSIILLAAQSSATLFASTPSEMISRQSNYFQSHDLGDVIILDPFMGGGTTLVEANRLGAKVVGCDINPISFWIVRETLKSIDLDKLDEYFRQLASTAGEKIKSLYRTTCVHCKASYGETLYAFWVRYVNCLHCGQIVYLFKRTLLNEGLSRNKPVSFANPAVAFCPQCFELNEWYGKGNCSCKQCGFSFDPQSGMYSDGYYTCPHCKKDKISLIKTLKTGQRLRERLVAIEYWCERCKDRLYKSPDIDDLARIAEIERAFETHKERLVFPRQQILEGASSVRWRQHNYRYYYEVFSARQLIAFNYLIEAIREIPEEEYRNAFITIFSNSLEYNNMMTPYNYPHRKLHHLFNYHALPLTTTPVENAVWGVSEEGAGTFVNCYGRYVRAKKYCLYPFDKFKDSRGVIQTVYAHGEKIAANFVSSFEELKQEPRSALLLCGDSSRLPVIPDKSIDFIVTDPPYFDNIHYSELSNFFYVWLTCLIEHPYFVTRQVPTEQEAIVNEGMDKGEEEYRHLLQSVFAECKRVLKDDGKLIFTFHHTKWQAWWTVLAALTESGYHVVDSFPVMSEYKVNPHVRNKQALDMDLVLICAKRYTASEPMPLEQVAQYVLEGLPIESANGSKNRLFLYMVGRLLKVLSTSWDQQKVGYEWFARMLTRFDNLLAEMDRKQKTRQAESPAVEQLRLF